MSLRLSSPNETNAKRYTTTAKIIDKAIAIITGTLSFSSIINIFAAAPQNNDPTSGFNTVSTKLGTTFVFLNSIYIEVTNINA